MKRTSLSISVIATVLLFSNLSISAAQRPLLASSGPMITLTPASGGMNSQVTVTGSGFPAGQQLGFYLGVPGAGFGGPTYAQVTTDTDGHFSGVFLVPGAWPNGDPILEPKLSVVAATLDGAVTASVPFAYTPAPLDVLGWRPYGNPKFGFHLMLPPGWTVVDQGEVIALHGDRGDVRLLLTPAAAINGGNVNGTPVFALSVDTFARSATPFGLQAGGTATLQESHPFTTRAGQIGSLTIWQTSASVSSGSSDGSAPTTTLVAAYLDLNKIVDGKYYRALDLSMALAPYPTIGTFNGILGSISVQQPVGIQDQAGIELAVKANVTTNAPYRVLVQGLESNTARVIILTAAGNTAGFLRLQNGRWTVLGIGNNLDAAFFQKNAIPANLQGG